MPPIYLTSDLLNYKRKPNLFNPINKKITGPDPYWLDVVVWLKGDTLTDSSSYNHSLTGSPPVVSDAQIKYGTGSLYFNGTWFVVPNPVSLNDFTIEWWQYKTVSGAANNLIDFRVGGTGGMIYSSAYSTDKFYDTATSIMANSDLGIGGGTNQWIHVAWCRSGSTVKIFKNGIEVATYTDANPEDNTSFYLGSSGGSNSWEGYISSFMVTSAARYTANFDPETDTYLAY